MQAFQSIWMATMMIQVPDCWQMVFFLWCLTLLMALLHGNNDSIAFDPKLSHQCGSKSDKKNYLPFLRKQMCFKGGIMVMSGVFWQSLMKSRYLMHLAYAVNPSAVMTNVLSNKDHWFSLPCLFQVWMFLKC